MIPVSTVDGKKFSFRSPSSATSAPCSIARSSWSWRRSAAVSTTAAPSRSPRRRIAGLDRRHLLRELREEVVVELVGDDEPLGRVAGLAGVVEAGVGRRLDGLVEVAAEQDERVGPAHLEHDLLQVAAGDLGDGRAGPLGAGHRDPAHPRVGDRLGDLLVGGEDRLIGPGGDPRVLVHLLDRRGRLGALRRRLEQDRVADDQVRAGEAGHLVVGEVPGHDPDQRAHRAPPDHRCAVAGEQIDRLVREELLGPLGVVAVDVAAEIDLAEGLPVGLPISRTAISASSSRRSEWSSPTFWISAARSATVLAR